MSKTKKNPKTKQPDLAATAATEKLTSLGSSVLAKIYQKISEKNHTLHDDEPVLATTWAIGQQHVSDRDFYEELCYHMFAAGFSRQVVRDKWPAHRQAFADFDPSKVAMLDDDLIETLVTDKALIRNRRKLTAVITNARKLLVMINDHGSVDSWLRSYPEAEFYLLHRKLADTFDCVGRSAAEWFMLSTGLPYHFETNDARRLLGRLGLLPKGRKDESYNRVMQTLQAASGVSTWEISIDLWRFASGFRMQESICAEAPHCPKCPLWDDCDYFNQEN
ncbi:MAG: DNA-3-methyladenine glycosylase I [Immundisolibacteraceae bacterium]|nr:DNA-3-methyladenine glycosylase I [Immundisolibacteraceae bacterium]